MQTEAGAVAFVKFYFEQVNKARMLPDPALLLPLIDPECGTCEKNVESTRQFVANNQRLDGPQVRVADARPAPGGPPGQVFVDLKVMQLPVNVIDAQGQTVSTSTPKELNLRAAARWTAGRWLVSAIGNSE